MTKAYFLILVILTFIFSCTEKVEVTYISEQEQAYIIESATSYMDSLPISVTADICDRSTGGPHDFYSEGDYWWPDPDNPDAIYQKRWKYKS